MRFEERTALVSMHDKYSWCCLFVYADLIHTQGSSDKREKSENVVQWRFRRTIYEFIEIFNICRNGLKHKTILETTTNKDTYPTSCIQRLL